MRKVILPILMLVTWSAVNAQQDRLARLLRELNDARRDTTQVNLYYSLSRMYWERNMDSVILMASKGIELADSIGFKKGKALNCLSAGVGLAGKGNYPEAIKYYLESLRLSEELDLEGLSGNIYSNIAIAYSEHADVDKAIQYFNKALQIAEKYGDAAACPALINLSDLYTQTREYGLAMKYATRALKISRELSDSSNLAISLFNIGEIHRKTDHTDSARWYLKTSQLISIKIRDYLGVSYCLNSLAELMAHEQKFREGIALAQQSLVNLGRIENPELQMSSYHILYECHSHLGDFKEALRYRNQEIALRDQTYTIEKERIANNLVNQYNLDRKELQIQLLEKDNHLQQKEIARGSLIKIIFGLGAFILALLAGYLIFTNIRWRIYNGVLKERNSLIQEQKKTIIHQKIRLERLNSAKDKIISIISHDFRSPLNTLRGFLELLKSDVLSRNEKAQTTERLERSLSATFEMVENLLTWGSGQLGGLVLNPVTFDLLELVEENIQLAHPRAEAKKITLVNTMASPLLLFADRETINIVLRNLISNAIKFSRQNDSISIGVREESHRVIISVKDTGVGMSREQQKSLFDGELNATAAGTDNEKGTGLGLALCQELIRQHGGEIWAESTLGAGSTFLFTIPRVVADL